MEGAFNDACLVIASDGQAYHPVTTNNFTVTVRLPQGLINQADPQKRPFAAEGESDRILTLKVANDDFKEPSFGQATITYKKGNLEISFPGTINGFNGTSTFHVFVTKSAYDILYSWKMASGNHLTGEVGDPDDYWGEVQVDVTTGNKGTLVGTWVLHNVWLSSLDGITFKNGDNSPKTCSITLQYFRPEWISGLFAEED